MRSFNSLLMTDYKHGTIIGIGITCKKIPCYMRDSACRWFIIKKLKYFEVIIVTCYKEMKNASRKSISTQL